MRAENVNTGGRRSERREVLGVVIPLANEEPTVAQLLNRVLRQIQSQDVVLCVLDNASTDGTRHIVERMTRMDRRLRLIHAPENRCVVDAYFRGYRQAIDCQCDWILEMDGGMSHCPEQIPRFVAGMQTGVDFVAGSRFIVGGSHRGSWTRALISRGGSLLSNALLGTQMKDMTSGFECFTRRAMLHILKCGVRSRRHFFQTEIRYRLHDFPWLEVPITYDNPSKSVGAASLWEALRILISLRLEVSRNGTRGKRPCHRCHYNSVTYDQHEAA